MKSALQILLDQYALTGWNDTSMLEIACQYIDNQCANDAFEDYVTELADREINYKVEEEEE